MANIKETSYKKLKRENALLKEKLDILNQELRSVIIEPDTQNAEMVRARVKLGYNLECLYWLGGGYDNSGKFNGFINLLNNGSSKHR